MTTRLDTLRTAADHCRALARRAPSPALRPEVARRLHTLFVAITACETGGYTRAEIADVVWPVRELVSASPLFHRLQAWPRGHQGDFETLARLCDDPDDRPVADLGALLDDYLLRSPIAQQYRNRVAHQAGAILDTLLARGRAARVLVLAAGPATDVRAVARLVRLLPGQLVLHDADAAALEWAASELADARSTVEVVGGGVLHALAPLAARGPYDLVVLGTALDELPDRHAVALLHALHAELLAPGGRACVTAAADANPFRPCLEYLTDWLLLERSERELVRLCQQAGLPPGTLTLGRDGTGLALLGDVGPRMERRTAA